MGVRGEEGREEVEESVEIDSLSFATSPREDFGDG